MDLVRGHKRAPSNTEPGGIRATSNRLETSKFILNDLKDVGKIEKLRFLTDAARFAIGTLEIVREIADEDIDENLLTLVLDSCGLMYLVINSCNEQLAAEGEISDRTKLNAGGLTRELNDIQTFVHKHVHRSFAKRLLKHSDDTQTIQKHRERLKTWMTAFLGIEDRSIHAVLDALVQEQWAKANSKRSHPDAIPTPSPRMDKMTLADVQPPPPPTPIPNNLSQKPLPLLRLLPDPPATPSFRSESPHQLAVDGREPLHTLPLPSSHSHSLPISPSPSVITHLRSNSRSAPLLNVPEFHGRPQSMVSSDDESQASENEDLDPEHRRQRRIEREKARKKAERARWLKSEEEFNQLPIAKPEEEDEGQIALLEQGSSSAMDAGIPIQPEYARIGGAIQPGSSTLPAFPRNLSQDRHLQDLESEKLAADLHEKTQRELTAEDERAAKILAAKLADEERRARRKKAERSNSGRSGHSRLDEREKRLDSSNSLTVPGSPRSRNGGGRSRSQDALDRGKIEAWRLETEAN